MIMVEGLFSHLVLIFKFFQLSLPPQLGQALLLWGSCDSHMTISEVS